MATRGPSRPSGARSQPSDVHSGHRRRDRRIAHPRRHLDDPVIAAADAAARLEDTASCIECLAAELTLVEVTGSRMSGMKLAALVCVGLLAGLRPAPAEACSCGSQHVWSAIEKTAPTNTHVMLWVTN